VVLNIQYTYTESLVASWKETAVVWKIDNDAKKQQIVLQPPEIISPPMTGQPYAIQVVWSPNGRRLATRTDKTVTVWDMAAQPPSIACKLHILSRVEAFVWLPSGNSLIVAYHLADNTVVALFVSITTLYLALRTICLTKSRTWIGRLSLGSKEPSTQSEFPTMLWQWITIGSLP
jgi:WD40 repeat protein